MQITVRYGQETFEQSNAKFQIFSHRCKSRMRDADVATGRGSATKGWCHLWQAAKDDPSFGARRVGGLNKYPAAPGYREDAFGKWSEGHYDVSDGAIIRLFGYRKLAARRGARMTVANLLLDVDQRAPLLKVYGQGTGDDRAAGREVLVFEGRAYRLTLDDAATLQVVLEGGDNRSSYQDYNQDALFRVVEVAAAIAARPRIITTTLVNSDGEEVTLTRATRRRAIQV